MPRRLSTGGVKKPEEPGRSPAFWLLDQDHIARQIEGVVDAEQDEAGRIIAVLGEIDCMVAASSLS